MHMSAIGDPIDDAMAVRCDGDIPPSTRTGAGPLVRSLIDQNTDGRFLGVIGEPGVNVLELNLAIAREAHGA